MITVKELLGATLIVCLLEVIGLGIFYAKLELERKKVHRRNGRGKKEDLRATRWGKEKA